MFKKILLLAIAIVIPSILAGCSSSDKGRYTIDDDLAPAKPIAVEHLEDAHPKYEPISLGGNKDYTLRGKSYQIVKQPKDFKQQGISSWYGKKFHGHLTSNGEIYDMYSMSAAHKTLPIPSYVKVTNKDNNKTTIVRINDRGPFHEGRIIDLSYAAAYKLDVLKTGTANVEIEYISVEKPSKTPINNKHQFIIQFAASKDGEKARTLAQEMGQRLSVKSFTQADKSVHRIFLGPFDDVDLTKATLIQVQSEGYPSAFIKRFRAQS
ncbi:septal ring lytic transglycosylase RlpA family protein [Vibrio tapetis]|uniref:Endolytic peptidoglycan transglycosylase RlpA n=1 Tax=Vibrio tapetis subsp. tapetis TaxID=1671868 RepID=A0A2N8ZBX7_9VIBR|nr:septal ring lytic transglycosylase RlpA family protein [Vibrio tapetis]SON49416.1 RlpA-like lipoprotein [Vibrio tapetis subsp. tapetis]